MAAAIGGASIGTTYEGLERYPISIRYAVSCATTSMPFDRFSSSQKPVHRSHFTVWQG